MIILKCSTFLNKLFQEHVFDLENKTVSVGDKKAPAVFEEKLLPTDGETVAKGKGWANWNKCLSNSVYSQVLTVRTNFDMEEVMVNYLQENDFVYKYQRESQQS